MSDEIKEAKTRRKRTSEGGWRIIKGNLYARIQYTDEFGRQKEKLRRANNKTHVRQLVREMKDELKNHGEQTLNADKMDVSELCELYKKAKVFPAVIRDGRKVAGLKSFDSAERNIKTIAAYFGKKHLRSIKPGDLEKFKSERLKTETIHKRERKLSSVNRELQCLRAMLYFAFRQGWILQNPFEKTESIISTASEPERNRVLGFEEEIRLLSFCVNERKHLKAILICALDTAMRPEEIYKLVWRDVDLNTQTIMVQIENSKTEKERIIGISDRLKTELDILWEASPKRGEISVFGTKSVKTGFKTACRLAKIYDFRFRDCRHTATTRMVNSGLPQAEIMKMTGHTQLKTFLRYVNLTPESVKISAKFLSSYFENKNREAIEAIEKQKEQQIIDVNEISIN